MRVHVSAAVALLLVCGPVMAVAQTGAHGHGSVPAAAAFEVLVRQADGGALAASASGNEPGRFRFESLPPGSYVIELIDAAGQTAGLSPSIPLAEGSLITVVVGELAAGALGPGTDVRRRLAIGPLAGVSLAGESGRLAADVTAVRGGRLLVCHAALGTRHTLEIRAPAREAHVRHGDSLGACPAEAVRRASLP